MQLRKSTEVTGEIKYRPPTGKPENRMLALATGKTENGDKIAVAKVDKHPSSKAALRRFPIVARNPAVTAGVSIAWTQSKSGRRPLPFPGACIARAE
jgi:hypothetical protein